MGRANLPLAFAELLVGGIILDAGIKGASIGDVIKGTAQTQSLAGSIGSTGAAASSGGTAPPFGSGAQGSRLDQGQDLTASQFNAPVSGTIVKADQTNSGWAGGGYVALKSDNPIAGLPSQVLYFAEGLSPTVQVGQHVNAGEQIAIPVSNPYNGIVGNIEWGLANPSNPGQPLAQTVSNARGMVLAFYNWARSIGAPVASSTSNAGHA